MRIRIWCVLMAYGICIPQRKMCIRDRYGDAQDSLEAPRCTPQQFEEGLRLLVIGLGAKVLLADKLGLLWNDIQTIGFESISTPLALSLIHIYN